jgi:anti-sigma regulatory factor (Ser/Thr protein kinase)
MPYYRCPSCGLTSYSAAGHSAASDCPNCSALLPVDAKLYSMPASGIARTLRARPEAVADARRAVAGLPLARGTRDTLALLASEIVTNAIRHAGLRPGDPIDVQATRHAGRVRLSVHDGGRGFDVPRVGDRDPGVAGGRGLLIVDALSDAWGVDCSEDGCVVWCEITPEENPAAASERTVTTRYVQELATQMAR